jgi:hypothetical protein
MKIRTFDKGRTITVTKERDGEHDHLVLTIDGERVGYFHLWVDGAHWFKDTPGKYGVERIR